MTTDDPVGCELHLETSLGEVCCTILGHTRMANPHSLSAPLLQLWTICYPCVDRKSSERSGLMISQATSWFWSSRVLHLLNTTSSSCELTTLRCALLDHDISCVFMICGGTEIGCTVWQNIKNAKRLSDTQNGQDIEFSKLKDRHAKAEQVFPLAFVAQQKWFWGWRSEVLKDGAESRRSVPENWDWGHSRRTEGVRCFEKDNAM